jgi:hypothetical protein
VVVQVKTLAVRPTELPGVNLEHLETMTDGTGILQHATFTVPACENGYCLDDNARALLLMTFLEDAATEDPKVVAKLASRYLAFVNYAFNPEQRRFRNFMSYSRRFTEVIGSEDSHGRAIWALGGVLGRSCSPGRRSGGAALPTRAARIVRVHQSSRLGVRFARHRQCDAFPDDGQVKRCARPKREALDIYRRAQRRDWPWFRTAVLPIATRLSQALGGMWGGNGERDGGRLAVAGMAGVGAVLGGRLFRAYRIERLLRAGWPPSSVRPATGRGSRHGLGLSRVATRNR